MKRLHFRPAALAAWLCLLALLACSRGGTGSTASERGTRAAHGPRPLHAPRPTQGASRGPSSIEGRFSPPLGFVRVDTAPGSFQAYVRSLPLRASGSPLRYFDGRTRRDGHGAAILDLPILPRDLVQCADAVIKIRAEYLYSTGRFADLSFTVTGGEKVGFEDFATGLRPVMEGSTPSWEAGHAAGRGREVFDEYLEFIYTWAGSYSLSRELERKGLGEVAIGDLFVAGGFPGHVMMVVDLARDAETGEEVMLLAQGYMPSQDIHIVESPYGMSPWYPVRDETLHTPDWTFAKGSLMRFAGEAGRLAANGAETQERSLP